MSEGARHAQAGRAPEPARILQIIASVDPRGGGPVESVAACGEIWRAAGHVHHVVTLDAPDAPWAPSWRGAISALGVGGGFAARLRGRVGLLRYGYTPHLTRWLLANAAGYDVVIVHGLWNYASLGSWRALHSLRKPYYLFVHGMLDPWFNAAYPLKTLAKRGFWRGFEHRVVRDAAAVLFTSEEERARARVSFRPYAARELVVGYGARAPDAEAAARARPPGRRRALFLGRLHEKKGIDLLLTAFARLAAEWPEVDLVIAGPDQGRGERWRALARRLGVEARVSWPGMLEGAAKRDAFLSAEFFVLPSHQENFGVAVAEALALGTPVLISDKVNIWREIVADGAGRVAPDTAEGVEIGLRAMLALTAREWEDMSASARRCFRARFDFDRNAQALLARLRQDGRARERGA